MSTTEQTSANAKPSTLQNFKNFMKVGSDRLKEKFNNLFNKKSGPINVSSQPNTSSKTPDAGTAKVTTGTTPTPGGPKKEENNEAFKIEDDMDNNDLSFHINNEEDDEEEEETKTQNPQIVEESKTETPIEKSVQNTIYSISPAHEKMLKEIEETDVSTFVHKVYLKGTLIDYEGFPAIACRKIKKKSKILSFMGFGKNKKEETLPYILILDDNFIYFIKDENNVPDKSNSKIKKVGNKYNIRLLSNVCLRPGDEKNVKILSLSFSKEEFSPSETEKVKKEFCFEDGKEQLFMSFLNLFLSKINKQPINLS